MEIFIFSIILAILYLFFHKKVNERSKIILGHKMSDIELIHSLYQNAIGYMNQKNYIGAKKEFQRIIFLGGGDRDIFFRYGLTLYYLKEYDRSLSFYKKALVLSENNNSMQVKIYQAIAKVWNDKGEHNESLVFYNKAMEISIKLRKISHG